MTFPSQENQINPNFYNQSSKHYPIKIAHVQKCLLTFEAFRINLWKIIRVDVSRDKLGFHYDIP